MFVVSAAFLSVAVISLILMLYLTLRWATGACLGLHNFIVEKKEIVVNKNQKTEFKDDFYKTVELMFNGRPEKQAVYVTYRCTKCKCHKVDKL